MTEEQQHTIARDYMKLKFLQFIEEHRDIINEEIQALIEKKQQEESQQSEPQHDDSKLQSESDNEQTRAAETSAENSP